MPTLCDDISRFFSIFESRNQKLFAQISPQYRSELTEELALLQQSVLTRVREEMSER